MWTHQLGQNSAKSHTIPYGYKVKVEEELDHLVKQGIIEPVQFVDWAAPIVVVLKSDKKSICICGISN